jgi:GNAT superfamily N-acetyltransferase
MRHLQVEEVEAAARVLARAFQNDPLQMHTFPDAAERAEKSIPHFAAIIRYGLLAGEVWTTDQRVEAVGVWWPPGRSELDPAAAEHSGLNALPELLGEQAMQRFMHVIGHVEALHRQDAAQPHWYAMVLGVEPGRQGQGLGSQLLQAVFEKADAEGMPCYLETCQPANVAFYRKHGFEVLREGTVPATAIGYWTFFRACPR